MTDDDGIMNAYIPFRLVNHYDINEMQPQLLSLQRYNLYRIRVDLF